MPPARLDPRRRPPVRGAGRCTRRPADAAARRTRLCDARRARPLGGSALVARARLCRQAAPLGRRRGGDVPARLHTPRRRARQRLCATPHDGGRRRVRLRSMPSTRWRASATDAASSRTRSVAPSRASSRRRGCIRQAPGNRVGRSGFALAEDHWRVWNPATGKSSRADPSSPGPAAVRAASAARLPSRAAARAIPWALPTARIAVHPGDTSVPRAARQHRCDLCDFCAQPRPLALRRPAPRLMRVLTFLHSFEVGGVERDALRLNANSRAWASTCTSRWAVPTGGCATRRPTCASCLSGPGPRVDRAIRDAVHDRAPCPR